MPSRPTPLASWSWAEAAQLLQPVPVPLDQPLRRPLQELLAELEPALDRLQRQHDRAAAPLAALAPLALELCARPYDIKEREQLRRAADRRRQRQVGETVSYVVNRNLNVSNHCVKHCSFCAFRRDPDQVGAYWLSSDDLRRRAAEAAAAGASELCLQGGLNPAARRDGSALAFAAQLLADLRAEVPHLHLHAFSPQELLFLAEQDGISLEQVLTVLRQAGLGSVPGTAAEVLSEPLRQRLCPEKLSARAWVAVVLEVHASGLPSTSTLMAGHIETPGDRVAHLLTLVAMQQHALRRGTAAFSEFVLLPFIGEKAPEALRRRVGRDQPDRIAMLELTAQARLLLGAWIPHHQPSWVKLTLSGASEALRWGCDDLGGTLMEEHITSMAGASGGTSQSAASLEAAARRQGRPVRRRTTLYETLPCLP